MKNILSYALAVLFCIAARPATADDEGDYDRVFSQEKQGFSQAKLELDGELVATLSVSDLIGDEKALKSYEGTPIQVAGFPAVTKGKLGTAVLAGGRFQVQVRSKSDAFGADIREAWLAKFDLAGLSKLAE